MLELNSSIVELAKKVRKASAAAKKKTSVSGTPAAAGGKSYSIERDDNSSAGAGTGSTSRPDTSLGRPPQLQMPAQGQGSINGAGSAVPGKRQITALLVPPPEPPASSRGLPTGRVDTKPGLQLGGHGPGANLG